MKLVLFSLLIFTVSLTMMHCGSSNSGDSPELTPTLSSIQTNVFNSFCALSGCHAGPSPEEGLSLEDGQSFSNLVGVASSEAPGVNRVEAGDADSSYIINKLEGTQADVGGSGVQMPFDGASLSTETINVIKEWINSGAAND